MTALASGPSLGLFCGLEVSMNKPLFFSRFCHVPILRRAAVTLVALAWSSLAFCGEIHDAAKSGDLEKGYSRNIVAGMGQEGKELLE